MYFIWSLSYCQFFNEEQLACVLHFVMLQVASLLLQDWLLQLHTQGTVKSTGGFFLHIKLKCIEYLYFATLLFWVTVYENVTLCIQNRMLQKWCSWKAYFESCSTAAWKWKPTQYSHRFDPAFIFLSYLIPMRWGYRKQNLLLMRWDIMTSHLELTDIFIVFLKAIYGGRMELD